MSGLQQEAAFVLLPAKSLQNFLEKLSRRSPNTAITYRNALQRFAAFLKAPTIEATAEIIRRYDPYDLLDGFACELMKELAGNTVRICLAAAKKWMRYDGIKIYNEEFKERIELPAIEQPLDEAPSREWIQQLLRTVKPTLQAAFLMSISGMRPQDIRTLRVGDIKFDEDPVRVIVPAKGKTRRGWETFITREAAKSMKQFLGDRIKDSNAQIFNYKPESLHKSFGRATQRLPGMNTVISEGKTKASRRYKYHLYCLKKFFESQVTMAHNGDRSIALAWEGRKAYLDNYLRLSLDEKRELYRRAEPRLLIFSGPNREDELAAKLREKGFTDQQIQALKELNLLRG